MPVKLPPAGSPSRPAPGFLGVVRFLLFLAVPAAAIYALVQWGLNRASATYVQPDAVFYRVGHSPTMAAVLTRFQAYATGPRGTYGTDRQYAAAYDLPTGRQLWKTHLVAPPGSAGAALLGQSGRYLFYACAGLYALDKQTGRVVAGPADYGPASANLSRAAVIGFPDNQNYRYDDSARAVLARGTDGLYYAIAEPRLLARPYTPPPRPDLGSAPRLYDGAGGLRQRPVPDYNQSITDVYDDGRTCRALLDDQDTVLLNHDPYGVAGRGRTESVRRRFYTTASDNSGGWHAVTPGRVYLFGGLLINEAAPYRQPPDSISRVQAYQSLRARYDVPYAPLRPPGGGWLVAHRATIEPGAPVLLTGVGAGGQVQWQANLGPAALGPRYVDQPGGQLYLLSPAPGAGTDQLQQVLQLDLSTGRLRRYTIRESNPWWQLGGSSQ